MAPEISTRFEQILQVYLPSKQKSYSSDSPAAKAMAEAANLLQLSDPIASRRHLKVVWSAGKGNWANIPWIAVMDDRETTTTQRGVYCVFLFRQDMTGFYWTLNQGVTQPQAEFGAVRGKEILRRQAERLRQLAAGAINSAGFQLNDDIDLRTSAGVGQDYKVSTAIHKLYRKGAIPPDSTLVEDLGTLLKVYDAYLDQRTKSGADSKTLFTVNGHQFRWSTEDVKAAFNATSEEEWVNRPGIEPFWHVEVGPSSKPVKAVFRNMPGLPRPFEFTKDQAASVFKQLGFIMLDTRPDISGSSGDNQLTTPLLDLQKIHAEFTAALRKAGVEFGARHDEITRTFLVSLATKRFVIITGLSGSGKTQIALRFGEWLGKDRYMLAPVRPDWTGSDALFGFEDALQPSVDGKRAWAVTEILRFVLRAAGDPDYPYVLILDEMNLAHVERYFADALSGMESGTACVPNLGQDNTGEWRAKDGATSSIPFPSNLFVVGTVNVDETTYMFSPKVLDRANTIEFRVQTDELNPNLDRPKPAQSTTDEIARGFLEISQNDAWRKARHPTPHDEIFTGLKSLHKTLAEGGFEFGHRVLFEVLRFSDLYRLSGDDDFMAALDLQVLQKLLPKLHGSRRKLEPVLNAIGKFAYDFTPGESFQTAAAFQPLNAPEAARLPRSFDKIRRMLRSLHANQFVSFVE